MFLKIAKFKFDTPAHFGQVGIGIENVEEIIHSDTLFGALCHSWASLFGKSDLDILLASFRESPPFLISSCFVYNGDTCFLPRPLTNPPGFENMDLRETQTKFLKGLNYLPREIFELWAERNKINYEAIEGNFPSYGSSYEFLLIPRVTLDRATLRSQIFHCGSIKFRDGCGLYCLVRFSDQSYEEKFKTSLSFLGELGLGGERSGGFGRFRLIWEDGGEKWNRLFSIKGNGYCCLSLFHPKDLETGPDLAEGASYTLIERRGWLLSSFSRKQYKRKTVVMFSEGSVFTRPIIGHLVDVSPEIWIKEGNPHPIYRYGYALTVPIQIR